MPVSIEIIMIIFIYIEKIVHPLFCFGFISWPFLFNISAKWSSTEEVNKFAQTAAQSSGSGENPGAVESPFVSRKNKDFKPVNFDGNSLKRPEIKSAEPSQVRNGPVLISPSESGTWYPGF